MSSEESFRELFEIADNEPLCSKYQDEIMQLMGCSIGAVIANELLFVNLCVKAAFALGVKVGREDTKLDIFRDALGEQ